jgi:hypothetical protein
VNEVNKFVQEVEDEELAQEFQRKKDAGMKSMEWFLNRNRKNTTRIEDRARELEFYYVEINTSTLTKLVSKKYKKFNSFKIAFEKDLGVSDTKHGVVFRQIWNDDYQQYNYYIHCIFVNKESIH